MVTSVRTPTPGGWQHPQIWNRCLGFETQDERCHVRILVLYCIVCYDLPSCFYPLLTALLLLLLLFWFVVNQIWLPRPWLLKKKQRRLANLINVTLVDSYALAPSDDERLLTLILIGTSKRDLGGHSRFHCILVGARLEGSSLSLDFHRAGGVHLLEVCWLVRFMSTEK